MRSSATVRASSGSSGMDRLPARTLPVPTGMMPMRTPDPAMPAATARTVPSPPAAMTTEAPSSRARTACPVPGSSRVVSRQCTWSMPSSLALRLMRSLNAWGSSCLEGFMMIQGRGRPRVGSSTEAGTARAWRRRCLRVRAVVRRATPIAPAPATAASTHGVASMGLAYPALCLWTGCEVAFRCTSCHTCRPDVCSLPSCPHGYAPKVDNFQGFEDLMGVVCV